MRTSVSKRLIGALIAVGTHFVLVTLTWAQSCPVVFVDGRGAQTNRMRFGHSAYANQTVPPKRYLKETHTVTLDWTSDDSITTTDYSRTATAEYNPDQFTIPLGTSCPDYIPTVT